MSGRFGKNEQEYNESERFETPERLREYVSPYDMPSQAIQDMVARRPKPFITQAINLATARSANDPLIIKSPGRGFVCFFFTTGNALEPVVTGGHVDVRVNEDIPECNWPAKHNRGFRGDFTELYLSWPAQSNVSVNFIVLKFDDVPWYSGEYAT